MRTVYALKFTSGDCYVGISSNVATRVSHHLGNLKRNVHPNPLVQRCYDENGEPEVVILKENATDEDEVSLVKLHGTLNQQLGAGSLGRTFSDETKAKIGAASSTRMTDEQKYKMAEGRRGKPRGPMSLAQREAISRAKRKS